jgi:hypothetical protein
MSLDIVVALLFCYTVVRVWVMLNSRRYGFIVKKNVPSMLIKIIFNVLNTVAVLITMFKFTNFLNGFENGGTDSIKEMN